METKGFGANVGRSLLRTGFGLQGLGGKMDNKMDFRLL